MARKLLDKINATKFQEELERSLKHYCDTLKKRNWHSPEWNNVRNRLRGFFRYSDLSYEP